MINYIFDLPKISIRRVSLALFQKPGILKMPGFASTLLATLHVTIGVADVARLQMVA